MLQTLGIVLLVVLCIPLALLALGLLAMVPRTGVHVRAQNGGATVMIFYGRLHRVFRLPRARKARRRPKTPEPASAQPKPPRSRPELDVGEALRDALGLLEQMKNQLRIDTLRADITIATGNAAQTGLLLGTASALGSMIYPFLKQTFDVRDFHAVIDGDFEGQTTHYTVEVSCSVRPIALLWLGLRNWRLFARYLKSIKTK